MDGSFYGEEMDVEIQLGSFSGGWMDRYFGVNALLVLYMKFVEKRVVFQGVRKDPLGMVGGVYGSN